MACFAITNVVGLNTQECLFAARFDVMNTAKSKWIVGVVVKIQDENGRREAKFHFLNHSVKFDEWIRAPSSRVAPLYSKTQEPPKRKEKKQQNFSSDQNENLDVDSTLADETSESVVHDGGTRPATISDESSPIHSPAKEIDEDFNSKTGESHEMGDFSVYSSEDEENEPEVSKAKRNGLKKIARREMNTPVEPEEISSPFKKGFKKLIPRKKTQPDDVIGSPLQSLDEDTSKKRRKKEKKNVSTFKPLIPRKRPQDKAHGSDNVSNGGSLIPRKSPVKQERRLTSLMKSENKGPTHAIDNRVKNASKMHGVDEKRQDPKAVPGISRKGGNPSVSSKKHHPEVAGELRSRVFEEPRRSIVPSSPSHRSLVDDEAGVVHEERRVLDDSSRPHSTPTKEDNRGSFDDARKSVRSPGTRSTQDIRRNNSFQDDDRSVKSRRRNDKRYSRDYDRGHPRDNDREAPREHSRRYDDPHRALDTSNYGRDGDRVRSGDYVRDYDRDYDRDYGRSPSRRDGRDYSRRYDESYGRDLDGEYKYSRDQDYYNDRDYSRRAGQGYGRDEGRDYGRRYEDDCDRSDDRDYRRRYERDYDGYDNRDHRRYDQEHVRGDDREYRRQYDRPRDGEIRRDTERQSDREFERGRNRSHSREPSRSYREDYSGSNERQRPSRDIAGRIDSPSKRRY